MVTDQQYVEQNNFRYTFQTPLSVKGWSNLISPHTARGHIQLDTGALFCAN